MTIREIGGIRTLDAHRRGQVLILVAGFVGLVAVVGGSVKFLGSAGMAGMPLLGAVLAAATALFLIPVSWIPATAVVLFAVIPDRLVPGGRSRQRRDPRRSDHDILRWALSRTARRCSELHRDAARRGLEHSRRCDPDDQRRGNLARPGDRAR